MDPKSIDPRRLFGVPAAFAATILLLSATMALAKLTENRREGKLLAPLDTFAREIQGFEGSENPALTDGVLRELKPTSYLSRTYRKGRSAADLFIAFYAQQRAGESMHSPKHCLPGSGWEIWNYTTADIPAGGSTYRVNQYSISKGGDRMVVLYWYQSQGRIIASEYMGKLLLAKDALLRNETSGSIVRIVVPDQPEAIQDAQRFAGDVILQMQKLFGA